MVSGSFYIEYPASGSRYIVQVFPGLASVSIILASKSLKENDVNKKSRSAMSLSIMALGLVITGYQNYAFFVSDNEFGIFVPS